MENGNNHAPVAKLYAPLELLKRILPSRESVAPEELAEYDRFVGSKDALGSEYEEFLKKVYGCSHEWGETVQEDAWLDLRSRKCRKCGIIHCQIRDEELVLAEYYEEKPEKER